MFRPSRLVPAGAEDDTTTTLPGVGGDVFECTLHRGCGGEVESVEREARLREMYVRVNECRQHESAGEVDDLVAPGRCIVVGADPRDGLAIDNHGCRCWHDRVVHPAVTHENPALPHASA